MKSCIMQYTVPPCIARCVHIYIDNTTRIELVITIIGSDDENLIMKIAVPIRDS